MSSNPKITFTFPYRWLKEDREFLTENIRRQTIKRVGGNYKEDLEPILAYRIIVCYHSQKPLNFNLTKSQVQTMLRPLFPNARCLGVDSEYTQNKSKTSLPLFDFRIYF